MSLQGSSIVNPAGAVGVLELPLRKKVRLVYNSPCRAGGDQGRTDRNKESLSMSDEATVSKVEIIKQNSRQLRGTLGEELRSNLDHFCADSEQLLKPHGIYQQDDRDD